MITKWILGLLLCGGGAAAQDSILFRQLLSDRSNFSFLKSMGGKLPRTLVVADSTVGWQSGPFWIEGLDTATYPTLLRWKRDEHHAYNRLVPELLPGLVATIAEMKALQQKIKIHDPRPLRLAGAGYATSAKAAAAPVRIELSNPVYSTDRRYAFLSAGIVSRSPDPGWTDQYGILLAAFYFDGKTWRKVAARGMLIL